MYGDVIYLHDEIAADGYLKYHETFDGVERVKKHINDNHILVKKEIINSDTNTIKIYHKEYGTQIEETNIDLKTGIKTHQTLKEEPNYKPYPLTTRVTDKSGTELNFVKHHDSGLFESSREFDPINQIKKTTTDRQIPDKSLGYNIRQRCEIIQDLKNGTETTRLYHAFSDSTVMSEQTMKGNVELKYTLFDDSISNLRLEEREFDPTTNTKTVKKFYKVDHYD